MSRLSRHKGHVGGSPEVLAAIARTASVHTDWLIDGTGPIELPNEETHDRYPERERALRRLEGLLPREVDATVRSVRFQDGTSQIQEIEWIDLALRRLKDHALGARFDDDAERDTQEAEDRTRAPG